MPARLFRLVLKVLKRVNLRLGFLALALRAG